jgi:hypothetical protein
MWKFRGGRLFEKKKDDYFLYYSKHILDCIITLMAVDDKLKISTGK